jgi:hypothetical protein
LKSLDLRGFFGFGGGVVGLRIDGVVLEGYGDYCIKSNVFFNDEFLL